MARPKKPGMDYFPKDVDSYGDRKIRKLLKEFGSKGAIVYDYLLCVIYRDKGYYVEYDGELAFDVADYLGCGISEDLVKEIIQGCVRYGLFNKRLFDMSNVLTSYGIQNRYITAKKTGVIDERIRVLQEETQVNSEESTESKVKESKVKESKFDFEKSLIEYGFEKPLINDWLQIRKKKKGVNSETAFNEFIKEIEKIPGDKNETLKIIIKRSWCGFEAEWLSNLKNQNNGTKNGINGNFKGLTPPEPKSSGAGFGSL